MNRLPATQQGAALLVALMFLIILTLLSVTAMRSSTMELRMATNEQEQRLAFDSAQSAVNAAMASTQLTVTTPGDITCFGFFDQTPACTGTNVKNINVPMEIGVSRDNLVRATLDRIGPCPRSISSSARGSSSLRTSGSGTMGSCAYFTVDSIYDATARRGGRIETQEGRIKLVL